MSFTVPLAMFGWIPAVFFLFTVLPPRRAVIAAFLLAWLFLPNHEYVISGIPNYDKRSATCAGVLLATILFDPDRFFAFRPHWADLPMLTWCLVPYASSVTNGLGAYDGVSASVNQIVQWGIPYYIGRLYFRDWEGLRELGIGILLGGLVYLPLCLYELKMSPQLHYMFYGFSRAWHNVRRGDGWRPMVFMRDGLALGMWMCMAALVATWLWRSGTLKKVWGLPAGWVALALVVTAVLCKSTGATVLLLLGLGTLYAAQRWRTKLVVVAVVLLPVAYMYTRSVGGWDGQILLDMAEKISEDRRGSLEFRFKNEDILVARALRQPVFGWGGWGRNRPPVEEVENTVTDGLWVIAIGINGLVGLTAITAVQLLPLLLFMRRCPPEYWRHPLAAVPAVLGVLLVMYCIDNLFNAMPNPVFLVIAGAVTGLAVMLPQRSGAVARAARGPQVAVARLRPG
ncbi:MAG: O-antigen ligase domain-containing protein [Phycisphaerales bacterium]|nr:O-antigen ligase domain-containing protein [Phycisphaerales bacterium]